MKEIVAIIRMNMMNQTKRALTEAGISSITATNCLGRGKGLVDMHLLHGAERDTRRRRASSVRATA